MEITGHIEVGQVTGHRWYTWGNANGGNVNQDKMWGNKNQDKTGNTREKEVKTMKE